MPPFTFRHASRTMNSSTTIVIVGGSFAGIKAAWDLRHRLDSARRIRLISDQPRTTFRASFPRVLFENLDLEKITMDLAENFKDTGIEFLCDPMTGVDQESDEVICQGKRYHFDYLILATGARHAYEVLPGWGEYNAKGMHSLDDLPQDLRGYVQYIEKFLGVPIILLSTGPGRKETLVLSNPF